MHLLSAGSLVWSNSLASLSGYPTALLYILIHFFFFSNRRPYALFRFFPLHNSKRSKINTNIKILKSSGAIFREPSRIIIHPKHPIPITSAPQDKHKTRFDNENAHVMDIVMACNSLGTFPVVYRRASREHFPTECFECFLFGLWRRDKLLSFVGHME